MRRGPLIVAVVNGKGGTGKTNTAVHLAHVYHERGARVVLVDADPQGSATAWRNEAPAVFPFDVVSQANRNLYRQLPDLMGQRYNVAVIDTPPRPDRLSDGAAAGQGIVTAALRLATVAVCPLGPTRSDVREFDPVRLLCEDVADLRRDGQAVPLAVLFTRVKTGTVSSQVWREDVHDTGVWVLKTSVGNLERYGQADGDNVINASGSAYGDVVTELAERGYSYEQG